MPTLFFSYSHRDENLRNQLEIQLAMLKRQGVIETWHDRRIGAGKNVHAAIDHHVNTDDIILLLVSPDFIASDYCYDVEMARAMERSASGEATVIPVILRACDWHHAPFGDLNAVPRDGRPVTQWPDIDEAFLQVAVAIREVAARISTGRSTPRKETFPIDSSTSIESKPLPVIRSSNLRINREFSDLEKNQFRDNTFEFIAKFFENSLNELSVRNPGVKGVFRRINANRFFASVYLNGKDVARGTIYIGGNSWGLGSICYVHGEEEKSNTMNECLFIESDNQKLFLKAMGLSMSGGDKERKLSQEGAAELLWGILVERLQHY